MSTEFSRLEPYLRYWMTSLHRRNELLGYINDNIRALNQTLKESQKILRPPEKARRRQSRSHAGGGS
jgi:hypothetical protein